MISFLLSAFINQSQPKYLDLSYIEAPSIFIEKKIKLVSAQLAGAKEDNKEEDLIYPFKNKYPVSSPYGMRGGRKHQGVDIAASFGTPVLATHSGIVTHADYESFGRGYGNVVVIEGERFHSVSAHLSKIAVHVGDEVKQGQYIGNVGESGWVSGVHLHYELRLKTLDNKFEVVDPATKINF